MLTPFLSANILGTFWEPFFSEHFFPAKINVLRKVFCHNLLRSSSISGQLMRELFGNFFVHSHSKRSTTVPIVSHMSNSQYLPIHTFTRKYCELLTCGTIGTCSTSFGVHHPQDIARCSQLCHTILCRECATHMLYLSVSESTCWALFFGGKKVLRKKCPKSAHKYD